MKVNEHHVSGSPFAVKVKPRQFKPVDRPWRVAVNERDEIAVTEARFKRRILHAPNRIAKLTACKMRRLNQLNATHFNSMRVSRIFH